MATNVTKLPEFAKIAARLSKPLAETAAEAVAPDAFGEIPAGVRNGIAQLRDCKIMKIKEGKTNQGELMFFARGVAQFPDDHEGQQVKGLGTSITEPLFSTPSRSRKTVEEHAKEIQKHLKKLLVKPGQELSDESIALVAMENWEETCAMLEEAKPYFRFRTYSFPRTEFRQHTDGKWWVFEEGATLPISGKGPYVSEEVGRKVTGNQYVGDDPQVNHTWGGLCDWVSESSEAATMKATTDGTAKPGTNGSAPKAAAKPAPAKTTPVAPAKPPVKVAKKSAPEPEPVDLSELTLDQLVELADIADEDVNNPDATNEEARALVIAKAKEVGIPEGEEGDEDETTIYGSPSYAAMAALIEAASVEGEAPDEAPESDFKVGDMFQYHPINPATKKPQAKAVEIELIGVDTENNTVTARTPGGDTGKPIKNPKTGKLVQIGFEELSPVS